MTAPATESHRAFLERMESTHAHLRAGTSAEGKSFLPGMSAASAGKSADIVLVQTLDSDGNFLDVPTSNEEARQDRDRRYSESLKAAAGTGVAVSRGGRPRQADPSDNVAASPLQLEAARVIAARTGLTGTLYGDNAKGQANRAERKAKARRARTWDALVELGYMSAKGKVPVTAYALACLKPSPHVSDGVKMERRRNGLDPI